jgi:flagellar biogenesis protein FliO
MTIAQVGSGIPGLKDDPIPPFNSSASGGVGTASLVQMLVALAIVVVLVRWLVPKYLKKIKTKSAKSEFGADVEVVNTTELGGASLHLIKVRGRTLLIGASSQGLSTLADLTEDSGVFHLAAPAISEQSSNSFDDVLARLGRLGGDAN